ncbi:MAG: pyridoxal phosphate-dependent aminotransferase, partial [Promethearchaeota archaeon]
MRPLSNAVLSARKSKIRELFELLLKSGGDAISFGIGQPDFTSPDYVNDKIIRAYREHKTQYAPALGIPQLREVVAKKFQSENDLHWVKKENTIITNGGSQALMLAWAVLTNPDDEIIISSPNFLSYYYLCDLYNVKCVEVPRNADYSPNLDAIRTAITPKTKFILINTPNNPTGYVYTKDEMDEIVKIVKENDLYLISDEVYEHFIYIDQKHISPGSYEGMADRTITLNAMSKTFGGTGLRLGYVAASETIINNMEKVIQYTTAGVNHPVQYGGIEGLLHVNRMNFPKILKSYNKKREFCLSRLQEMKFDVVSPKGAFYIMPKLNPEWNMTAEEFSQALVDEEKVACVPGDAFGSFSGDSLRISYATDDKKLEEGFRRIENFLKNHK